VYIAVIDGSVRFGKGCYDKNEVRFYYSTPWIWHVSLVIMIAVAAGHGG
jgi:hypothetical protein